MEVLDIGLNIIATPPNTSVPAMVFQMMKVLKYMWVMEDLDIGILRPSTRTLATTYFILLVTMVDLDIGLKIIAKFTIEIVVLIILMKMV